MPFTHKVHWEQSRGIVCCILRLLVQTPASYRELYVSWVDTCWCLTTGYQSGFALEIADVKHFGIKNVLCSEFREQLPSSGIFLKLISSLSLKIEILMREGSSFREFDVSVCVCFLIMKHIYLQMQSLNMMHMELFHRSNLALPAIFQVCSGGTQNILTPAVAFFPSSKMCKNFSPIIFQKWFS